jgi:ActR/RegA family two-component response regulator
VCFWTELLWRHRALTTLNPKSKLLLVEDDKSISQTLRTILLEEGYEVRHSRKHSKSQGVNSEGVFSWSSFGPLAT